MHIAVGCDHRGLDLKRKLIKLITEMGHDCEDFGCYDTISVDYPDIACKVAKKVADGEFEHGILICSTGIGMSMTANKMPGVRAALCHDAFTALRARQHNDANVLCLGAETTDENAAFNILRTYLTSDFEGGRHTRRLEKIRALETELTDSATTNKI
jgi:ribose 5-phosphate isomerase B